MADPTTVNIGLAQPTRGTDIGAWDTPMNNNASLLDLCIGGTTTISLNNSNVILSAAQFQAGRIVLNSTLTGSVVLTFPTSFTKSYTVQNLCTGSSAFTVTLQTTAAGGQVIACPPGQSFEVWNDGANLSFHNFGPPIGGYWDYCGSSNPAWNTGCTVPPYLNCDGTTFNPATYPALFVATGSSILPDFRGRSPAYLNQGTGRMTSGAGGVDGNTLNAAGGTDTRSIAQANLPNVSFPVTDPGHAHGYSGDQFWHNNGGNGLSYGSGAVPSTLTINSAVTGISVNSGGSGTAISDMQPTCVGGLRLIRAG